MMMLKSPKGFNVDEICGGKWDLYPELGDVRFKFSFMLFCLLWREYLDAILVLIIAFAYTLKFSFLVN